MTREQVWDGLIGEPGTWGAHADFYGLLNKDYTPASPMHNSPIACPAPPVPARVANQLAPRVLRCAGAMCERVCVAWGAADGDNLNTNTQHGGLLL